MPKSDLVRLRHMLEAAQKARDIASGRLREDLDSDEVLRFALIHLLELIGEAATGLSDDLREREPGVPWAKIVALRNRLIHGYFDVDLDIVWDTLQTRVPPLIEAVESVIARLETEGP
jgi:uncharacterized protein with HEPN domain